MTDKQKAAIVEIKKIIKRAGGGQKEYEKILKAGAIAFKKTLEELGGKK